MMKDNKDKDKVDDTDKVDDKDKTDDSNTRSYRNDKMEMIVNYVGSNGDWIAEDIYLFNN